MYSIFRLTHRYIPAFRKGSHIWIQARKWKDKVYSKTFSAATLVAWLIVEQMVESKEEALMVGNLLVLSNVIVPIGVHSSFEGKKKEFYALADSEVHEGDLDELKVSVEDKEPATSRMGHRSASLLSGMKHMVEKEKAPKKRRESSKKFASLGSSSTSKQVVPLPSISLEEMMQEQKEKAPDKSVPILFELLIKALLEKGGCTTEGIFRVSAHIQRVRELKSLLRRGDYDWELLACQDMHVLANCLKQMLMELSDPLIPEANYSACVSAARKCAEGGKIPEESEALQAELKDLAEHLPAVNKALLGRLVGLLRVAAQPENREKTKMEVEGLAVTFAPVFMRCLDPAQLFQNASLEAAVVQALVRAPTSSVWAELADKEIQLALKPVESTGQAAPGTAQARCN